jgi:hypothetical protein
MSTTNRQPSLKSGVVAAITRHLLRSGDPQDMARAAIAAMRKHDPDKTMPDDLDGATFVIRLRPAPGSDGIRALRLLLKVALRRFGMRAVEVKKEHRAGRPSAQLKEIGDMNTEQTLMKEQEQLMKTLMASIFDKLENEPHDDISGLRRRYYYRGGFWLLECLTPRGLAVNVERLRRRGEIEHADRLSAAWHAAQK